MPFTFSHPAAILPLRLLPRHLTSLTGLVVGSMAPDFEYFIRMRGYGVYGHTWAGLIWFCLPVAITLSFIYHYVVRDAFIDNLPGVLRRRVLFSKSLNWGNYFKNNFTVVVISILAGSVLHVLWDGLTHKHGLFVTKDGWFDQAFVIGNYIMPRYKMLQHLSTVVGGIAILIALLKLPQSSKEIQAKSIFRYWFIVVSTMLVVTAVRLAVASNYDRRSFNVIIVTIVAGWLIGMVIASISNRKPQTLN